MITELTDPQNSSDAGRYVEIYNSSSEDIDLSIGYALARWTNVNEDVISIFLCWINRNYSSRRIYIVCNDAAKFSETYGFDADQDIGTGGAADSNGDDNIALFFGEDLATSVIVDIFGVPGEDEIVLRVELLMNLKMVEHRELVAL